MARLLHLNRKTVARKLLFLGNEAESDLMEMNHNLPKVSTMEFDDLETFEHSKCKPLSVPMAVEYKTRRIIGLDVARMPAKGKLAQISRKRYGRRKDERPRVRKELFKRITPFIEEIALIKSDESPHYPRDLIRAFPKAKHKTYKGRKACVVGQGELKKGGFDPLFSINHTFAKLRADIHRLIRRTWSTTKRPEMLRAHLMIYTVFHNESLMLKEGLKETS